METGNIDKPAICKECGVTTTLDSVQQICWECWTALAHVMELRDIAEGKLDEEE